MVTEAREEDVTGSALSAVAPFALLTALWSALCAALVQHGCTDINPAIPFPVPGTPRADYCDPVTSVTPWLTLTVLPTGVIAVIAWFNRKNPRRIALCVFVVALLLTANAIVANSLTYSVSL